MSEPLELLSALFAQHTGERRPQHLAALVLTSKWLADRDAAAKAYRDSLLAEVELLRAQIAAVRVLADKWEHGALRWADPLPVPPEVALIRAALDRAP